MYQRCYHGVPRWDDHKDPPSRQVETLGLHRNGQVLQLRGQLDTLEVQIAGQKLPQIAGQHELV